MSTSATSSASSVMERTYHLPCKKVIGSWVKKGSSFSLKANCPYCGDKILKRDLSSSIVSGKSFSGYVKHDCGHKFFLEVIGN